VDGRKFKNHALHKQCRDPNVADSDVWGFYQKDMLCYYTNDSAIYAGNTVHYTIIMRLRIRENYARMLACIDGCRLGRIDRPSRRIRFGLSETYRPATSWFYLTGSETNESGFNASRVVIVMREQIIRV